MHKSSSELGSTGSLRIGQTSEFKYLPPSSNAFTQIFIHRLPIKSLYQQDLKLQSYTIFVHKYKSQLTFFENVKRVKYNIKN